MPNLHFFVVEKRNLAELEKIFSKNVMCFTVNSNKTCQLFFLFCPTSFHIYLNFIKHVEVIYYIIMLDFFQWKTGEPYFTNIYIYHVDVSKTVHKSFLYTSPKSGVEILSNIKQIH